MCARGFVESRQSFETQRHMVQRLSVMRMLVRSVYLNVIGQLNYKMYHFLDVLGVQKVKRLVSFTGISMKVILNYKMAAIFYKEITMIFLF